MKRFNSSAPSHSLPHSLLRRCSTWSVHPLTATERQWNLFWEGGKFNLQMTRNSCYKNNSTKYVDIVMLIKLCVLLQYGTWDTKSIIYIDIFQCSFAAYNSTIFIDLLQAVLQNTKVCNYTRKFGDFVYSTIATRSAITFLKHPIRRYKILWIIILSSFIQHPPPPQKKVNFVILHFLIYITSIYLKISFQHTAWQMKSLCGSNYMGEPLFEKMNTVKDHTETASMIKKIRQLSLCYNFPNVFRY
jgi:hypothetical protein